MTAFRMLAVDLDGTALTHHNTLTDADRRAAHALRARGVAVTIATGRLYTGTRWVAHALGATGTVAVMNGSERVALDGDRSVHADTLAASELERIQQVLAEHELSAFLFRSREIHHDPADVRMAPYLGVWTPDVSARSGLLHDPVFTTSTDVLAVGVVGPRDRVQAAHVLLEADDNPVSGVQFDTYTGERFLKLRHGTNDKATALAALARDRGHGIEQVVAVGDWINDLPMLRAAGRSFAMGGSVAEVVLAAHEELDARRGEGGGIAEIARRVWDVPRSEIDG